MAVNSFVSNQGTQTNLLTDNTGGTGGTLIPVYKLSMDVQGTFTTGGIFTGTILGVNNIGTLPNLPQGSINVTAGTINAGTVNAGTVNTGTLNTGTINTGTINLGTVVGKDANAAPQTGNPTPMGGTDGGGTVYTFKTDTKGQMYLGGGSITTLPNLPQGSINVTAGTMSAGTLNTGTINTGTINTGTFVMPSGTLTILPNLPQGSINVTAGTVSSGTINTGTVNTGTVNTGTVNSGTINVGTFQINPLTAANTISHAGTSGTTAIGTLVTAATFGAGTAGYITSFHILTISGTLEMILAFGSVVNGNQVIVHGIFPAGGGIAKDIAYPHGYGTTNSPITYQILSGSGTASWDVNYFPHT